MSNIQFSDIQITKALHEAVKGCSEITKMPEQDFIHMAIAYAVGTITSRESREGMDREKFTLFFQNIQHEQERKFIGNKMISKNLTIENREEVEEEQEKFRQDKGYLISEIPPQYSHLGSMQMGPGDPFLFFEIQNVLSFIDSIDDDPRNLIILILYLKSKNRRIRQTLKRYIASDLIKIAGKALANEIDDLLKDDDDEDKINDEDGGEDESNTL